ncbi:MAG: hypothetical protein AAGB34_07490 [Planctomycetota bacterium]
MTQAVQNPPCVPTIAAPQMPRVSVVDGRTVAHIGRWLASLPDFLNLLDADEPWITFTAIEWLERVITPEFRVAEFGSGASTLYWAKRVAHVVAVEHHAGWHSKLTDELKERGVSNCDYILAEPKPLNGQPAKPYGEFGAFRSLKKGYEDQSFEAYASAIDSYDDASFDLVFVDGRARVACAERSISKIKRGGYLVLDNAERERYDPLRERLSQYRRIDLTGIGPRQFGTWTTSVWHITG